MSRIAMSLLRWYARHGRKDLPWQKDPTPYRVWVSEIMLQQTQVSVVIPYYLRFIESFPDVGTLAAASTDDVLRHWSGLGYYARARNMHRAARAIRDECGGVFPLAFDRLVRLPGIGRSTAGAILALACNERYPILDGNAKRVLARYHAIPGWPGRSAVSRQLWALADEQTPQQDAAAYTQAIMDLGATICTRGSPRCTACPLSRNCVAYERGSVAEFPGRRKPRAKPVRHTHMLLAHINGSVYLERRPAAGIWGGLWSLPEIPDESGVSEWCERELNTRPAALDRWRKLRHSFSHYDLDIQPIAVRLEKQSSTVRDSADRIWYELGSPLPGGMAAPVSKLLQTLGNP